MEKYIWTSIWSVQHTNASQNIQQCWLTWAYLLILPSLMLWSNHRFLNASVISALMAIY